MAKIINGKVVNTEADNKYVEEWLKRQSLITLRIKETKECFLCPCVIGSED